MVFRKKSLVAKVMDGGRKLVWFELLTLGIFVALVCSPASRAETISPVTLNTAVIGQVAPPQFIPTDTTPFTINPERNSFNPGYKFKLFQALPERLWFTATAEASQRLDTNVLFTARNPKADYAFRILPNITVGYNIAKNTSVYANYFVIKDSFAKLPFLNRPTTQSLSWGIQHNKRLGDRTNLQYNFQARELWQAQNLHQFDFIPGITLTHTLTPRSIVYASALLQMRGGTYFVAPTRELDPFYTLGYIHAFGRWTFIATDTLVTNFRHPTFQYSVPNQSNVSMIADLEINRPIMKKFPSALAFVRAEPVFNWDSHRTPGIAGFDFRLYGGMRVILSKPSYYGQTQDMRKQLMNKGSAQPSAQPGAQQSPNQVGPTTTPGSSTINPAMTPGGSTVNSSQASVTDTMGMVAPASSSVGSVNDGRLVIPDTNLMNRVNFIPGSALAPVSMPSM